MKYLIIAAVSILPFFSTQAVVTSKFDTKNECTRYSIVHKIENDQGELQYERELEENEYIYKKYFTTGMTLKKLNIDFENNSASFIIKLKMPLRVNRPLLGIISNPTRVSVNSRQAQFNKILNTVNADLNLIKEICMNNNNELKYVTFE